MPPFGPLKRRVLIRTLRRAGLTGPFTARSARGGRAHEIMITPSGIRVSIPNPHKGDIGHGLLNIILREARISRDEWERL